MPNVSTAVGRLYVDDRGGGPPVVLWPSLLSDGTLFQHQKDDLARDHRVLTIDPPVPGRVDRQHAVIAREVVLLMLEEGPVREEARPEDDGRTPSAVVHVETPDGGRDVRHEAPSAGSYPTVELLMGGRDAHPTGPDRARGSGGIAPGLGETRADPEALGEDLGGVLVTVEVRELQPELRTLDVERLLGGLPPAKHVQHPYEDRGHRIPFGFLPARSEPPGIYVISSPRAFTGHCSIARFTFSTSAKKSAFSLIFVWPCS